MPTTTSLPGLYLCKVISTPSGLTITHYPVVGFVLGGGGNSNKPEVMLDSDGQKKTVYESTITIPPGPPTPIDLFYDGARNVYVYNGEEYFYERLQRAIGFADPYGG